VVEANLVPENRFADAGRALDDVEPALQEAALQHGVEPGNAAWHMGNAAVVFIGHVSNPFAGWLIYLDVEKDRPSSPSDKP
jgi:hypothetical protein